MSYVTRTVCRCCGSAKLTPLFSLGEQHVNAFPLPGPGGGFHCPKCNNSLQNAVPDGSPDSLRCASCKNVWAPHGPKVPIDIELCRDCTLVQAKHTAPPELLYSGHYWYKSSTTQTMSDALANVALAVERRVELRAGDLVLDIGSNDGTLLECFNSNLVRVGVEPASNFAECYKCGANQPILIQDFWPLHSTALGNKKAKAVTALGMLYDLEDANAFIADVAKVLAPDGVFCAQLMCLKQTLTMRDVGNFCHEHLEFYSLRSLIALLNKHGLFLEDVEENAVNGGSYRLWIGGRHSPRKVNKAAIQSALWAEVTLDRPETLNAWFTEVERMADEVTEFVEGCRRSDKKVWAYGASTKGNTLLQWWGLNASHIEAAAERDPSKWGRVTVGTNIPIVSEEEFRKAAPDYAVILPYAFLPEMVKREGEWLWKGGKFIVPLPTPQLVWTEDGKLREEKL